MHPKEIQIAVILRSKLAADPEVVGVQDRKQKYLYPM